MPKSSWHLSRQSEQYFVLISLTQPQKAQEFLNLLLVQVSILQWEVLISSLSVLPLHWLLSQPSSQAWKAFPSVMGSATNLTEPRIRKTGLEEPKGEYLDYTNCCGETYLNCGSDHPLGRGSWTASVEKKPRAACAYCHLALLARESDVPRCFKRLSL